MAERRNISKKTRFEVFKRDSFTCQYCGRMAPDVILEIDHIKPVASGGNNGIMNLITSCFDCNRGKGKRKLSEKEEVKKQQDQLAELNKKREQLRMMMEWREELDSFLEEQAKKVSDVFESLTNVTITEYGIISVKRWVKEFGLIEVLDCLEISANQYFKAGGVDAASKVFQYIPRICNVRKRQNDDPLVGKRNYLRSMIKNNFGIYSDKRVWRFLTMFVSDEDSYHEAYDAIISCDRWSEFWEFINETYEGGW